MVIEFPWVTGWADIGQCLDLGRKAAARRFLGGDDRLVAIVSRDAAGRPVAHRDDLAAYMAGATIETLAATVAARRGETEKTTPTHEEESTP